MTGVGSDLAGVVSPAAVNASQWTERKRLAEGGLRLEEGFAFCGMCYRGVRVRSDGTLHAHSHCPGGTVTAPETLCPHGDGPRTCPVCVPRVRLEYRDRYASTADGRSWVTVTDHALLTGKARGRFEQRMSRPKHGRDWRIVNEATDEVLDRWRDGKRVAP